MPPNSPARDPPRRTPHAPARKTKREELSNLLERFYYGDDGTVGVAVDAFSGEPREERQQENEERSSAPCPLHPQTRRRHGLCPLCSALLAKELKRRGSGGSVGADGGGGGNFRRADSTGSGSAGSSGARRRRRSKGGGGSFDSFDASDSFEESDVNSINNGRRRASPAPSDFDDLLLAHGGELGALAREALGRSGARCERALFGTLFDEPSGGAEPKPTTARRGERGRGRANSPQAAATSDDAEGPQSPSLEHSTDRLLDPKWARALRQISARLSSRHSSGSLDGLDADEQDYTSYRRAQSRSLNSLNYPEEDAASSPLSRKRRPPDNDEGRAAATPRDPDPPKSLSQLREVVEMAARSAGRFAPADDWDVDPSLRGDSSDDARSATSMDARSASGAGTARGRKNFAERKGTIFPVGPSLRREGGGRGGGRAGRRSAKGAGAGPSDGRKGEGFARSPADSGSDPEPPVGIVRSVQDAASASGSDSSLTFSLCSKDSFGSSASSLAPGRNAAGRGTAPTAPPIKEKAHTVSPTSVTEEVSASASSAPSPTRVPSASVRGEPRAIPFGPPFDGCVARSAAAAAAESSSEEEENLAKELVRAVQRQVPERSNHADVAVEDVYSDSDEDERTVYPEPAPTAPLPRSTPQKPQPPKQPASTTSPHHGHKAKQTAPHMPPAPAAARPTRRESSFFSALVQNDIKSSWPYDGNNCECIKDDSCGNSTDSSLGSTGTWPWEKPSSTSSSTGTHGSTHVSSPNNPNPPASESSESRHQTSGNHSSRAKLWDLYLLQPIGEIPNEDSGAGGRAAVPTTGSNNNLYGGGLGSSQLKRYDVQWAPTRRGVVSTCSFDRKVQIHSVAGLATKCGRPPKWMRPSSGVSCGFGGVLVSINIPQKYVKIHSVVEHPQLVEASRQLEMEFDPDDCISYCRAIAERANDEHESLGSGVCFRSALELDHFRRNGEVLVPRLSLVEVWRLFGRDPEQHPVVVAAFSIVVGLGKAQGDEAGGRSKIPLAPIVLVLYIILQFSSAVEQPTISDSPVSLLPSPLSQNFVGAVATSISSLALGYSSRRFWFVPSWLRIHGPLHHCMSVWVCSHGLPSTTVNSTLWFGISSFLAKCWAALYSYNTSFAWKNGSMYLLQKWCLQCWWSLGFCGFIAITACGCVPSITVYIRLLWRTTSCCACMATHLLLISLPCGVLRLFSVVWFCDYFDARKWWKCLRSYVDATLASIPWSACMQRVSLSPMDIVFGVLWVVGSVTIWLLHQCLALLPHHQLRIRQLTFMQSPSSSLILSRRCHTHLISPPCLLWSLIQSRLLLSRPLLDDPCRLQQSLLHQRETCCELVKNIWLRVYGVGIFATMPLFWLKNIDDGLAFLLQWLVLVQLMLHFPMLVWQHTNTTTTDLLVQPAFTSTMFFPDMWSYLWLTATFLFKVVISVNLVLMRVPPWCDICQFLSAHVFCVSKDYALWVSLPSSQNMMHRIGVYWLITGLLPTFTSILWRYTSSRSRHFPVLALLRVLASHDLLLQMMITHQHRPITSCPCQLSLLRQIDIVINTFLSSTSPEGVVTQTPEGVVTLLFFVFGAINAMVLNVPFYHNIGSRGSVGHTEKHSHVYLTSMYSTITLWQYQTKSNTKMKCYLAMIAKEFGFYNQYLSSAC